MVSTSPDLVSQITCGQFHSHNKNLTSVLSISLVPSPSFFGTGMRGKQKSRPCMHCLCMRNKILMNLIIKSSRDVRHVCTRT